MGAHFVANILKYNIKSSNFVSRRLVTESPFLTLLTGVSMYCVSGQLMTQDKLKFHSNHHSNQLPVFEKKLAPPMY